MTDEEKRARARLYRRRYNARHPERVKKQRDDFYARNRERILREKKEKREADPDKYDYYARNRARILRDRREKRAANPEKYREARRRAYWREKIKRELAALPCEKRRAVAEERLAELETVKPWIKSRPKDDPTYRALLLAGYEGFDFAGETWARYYEYFLNHRRRATKEGEPSGSRARRRK